MEKIIKQEPVTYIKFKNGCEIKFSNLIDEIDEMINAGWTEFNLKTQKDKTLLELIKCKCTNNEIQDEVKMSEHIVRIYWNENENTLTQIINEIHTLVYSK